MTYSIYHGDKSTFFRMMQEHPLMHDLPFFRQKGLVLDRFTLKEYHPVINSRVHQVPSA